MGDAIGAEKCARQWRRRSGFRRRYARTMCGASRESKVSDVEFKLVCDEPEGDASDDEHVSWGCLGESAIAIYQGVGGWKLDIRG